MKRALAWFGEHRLATLAIAIVYAIVTIRIHEVVNGLVRGMQRSLGQPLFSVLAWAVLFVAGVVLAWAIASAPRSDWRRLVAWALLFAVAAAVAYVYLFTVVSEAVHYAQYAILTALLFPLVRRIGAAMLWANLIGFADEAHQYWILHPDWGVYLDWNDIVINALGALLGGLCLATAIGFATSSPARRRPSAAFGLTLALLLSGWVLTATGRIALHAGAGGARPPGAWTVLDRGPGGEPFWMTADWAGKRFHILSAPAGAAALAAFALLALAVDRSRRPERA